jgi:hypothetical protein
MSRKAKTATKTLTTFLKFVTLNTKEVESKITEMGRKAVIVKADVSNLKDVEKLVKTRIAGVW